MIDKNIQKLMYKNMQKLIHKSVQKLIHKSVQKLDKCTIISYNNNIEANSINS